MTEYLQELWVQWGQAILAEIPHIIQATIVALLTLLLAGRVQRVVERPRALQARGDPCVRLAQPLLQARLK